MDMQSLLTLTIEVIFWAFVTLVIFQFINGLFVSDAYTSNVVSVSNLNIAASTIPSVSQVITFEKLPDPWTLDDEVVHRTSNEAVILSFPTLRLLPPVKEISPQPKRTTRSNKANNTANKSPKTKKADVNYSGKRKPGRPHTTA
ncbi:hypothetical protein CDG77_28370 [Nostoc sp. 'Peltigera membranacea cyanobiont' 213]|uniref:hypothetical protein n=2 Tax=Nostoc cyanobionts TaxID=3123326 RepID=UPI000B952195|nr:hypothetical protein [Nostoc sp. 'Peltigera membranacea cyanobiont' 213]AVH63691.1 hypothetical protein NPM_1916 [Nostoc sp. 'Peltigera membranacea cyanobiont' N6]OYD87614.1 hypothetical protein CDG77_28370 [Nostoc sp. 'Peltigera membranacea cyanobiont' 213]